MRFVNPTHKKPKRGISASSTRQIVLYAGLLGLLVILSYRLSLVGEVDFAASPIVAVGAKTERRSLDLHAERLEPAALSLDRGDNVFDELLKNPERHRGQVVEVSGNVVADGNGPPLRRLGGSRPSSEGIEHAFESYLLGSDGKLYLVRTALDPSGLAHMEGVRLRGRFSELYTGDVVYEGELRKGTIPLLEAGGYDRISSPAGADPSLLALPAAAGVAAAGAMALFLLRRRSGRAYEARRIAARTRQPCSLRAEGGTAA